MEKDIFFCNEDNENSQVFSFRVTQETNFSWREIIAKLDEVFLWIIFPIEAEIKQKFLQAC